MIFVLIGFRRNFLIEFQLGDQALNLLDAHRPADDQPEVGLFGEKSRCQFPFACHHFRLSI